MAIITACSLKSCDTRATGFESVVRVVDEFWTEMGVPKDKPSRVEFCGGADVPLGSCESFQVKWSDGILRATLIPRHDKGRTSNGESFLLLDTLSNPPELWETTPLWGGVAHIGGACKVTQEKF